jgi:hypothetical protein
LGNSIHANGEITALGCLSGFRAATALIREAREK